MLRTWITTGIPNRHLIQRAQDPDDHQAWDDFVKYYESFIFMVLRKSSIKVIDEEDLVQTILLKVWKGLPKYEYRKEKAKFRTWLSTIIRNTVITHITKAKGEDGKIEKYSAKVNEISESSIEKVIEQEWCGLCRRPGNGKSSGSLFRQSN